MRNKFIFIFCFFSILMCHSCQETEFGDRNETPFSKTLTKIKEIENVYGIRIYYKDFINKYSTEWQNDYEWTYLSKNELISFIPKLELFLSRYPETFIRPNLNEVRIFKSLRSKIDNPNLGFLGGSGNIRVVLNSISDEYLFKALHHELAHNVHFLSDDFFPTKEWQKVHDDNNNYINYGAYYDTDTTYTSEMLYENGFISYYCTAALSEDFAEYASYHYTKYDFLMELKDQHDAINKKYTLFRNFYNDLGAKIE